MVVLKILYLNEGGISDADVGILNMTQIVTNENMISCFFYYNYFNTIKQNIH